MENLQGLFALENKILGKGSFGTVYLGMDLYNNKYVALKKIPSEIIRDPQKIEALSNEILISAGVDNVNLVRILDLTEIENNKYIVYEFCNGGDLRRASELAKTFINRFNSTEATAIVMLSYNEDENTEGDGHWRNVLRYACDGGFGAMLDEYVHMVSEGTGYGAAKDEETEAKNEQIHETMVNALKIHTARYLVETYPAFELKMQGKDYQRTFSWEIPCS